MWGALALSSLPSCLLVPSSATPTPASSRHWLCGQDSVPGSTPPSRDAKSRSPPASCSVSLSLGVSWPPGARGSEFSSAGAGPGHIHILTCRGSELPHAAEWGSGCPTRRRGPGVAPPLHTGHLFPPVTLRWPCHGDSRPLRILASQPVLVGCSPENNQEIQFAESRTAHLGLAIHPPGTQTGEVSLQTAHSPLTCWSLECGPHVHSSASPRVSLPSDHITARRGTSVTQ